MADRERAARADGDIVRGKLTLLVGALAGATIAMELSSSAPLVAFAKKMLSSPGEVGAALVEMRSLLFATTLPIVTAALLGALLLGLLETRGYLGALSPTTQKERTGLPLAFVGWILLAVVALQAVRLVLQLGAGGAPDAMAQAAVALARRTSRGLLIALMVIALADHLLRANARRARLGDDRPQRAPTSARPDDRAEPALANATLVVFDDDQALALAGNVVIARGRGLAARAIEDIARRRNVRVRAADLRDVELGATISDEQLAKWGRA